MKKALFTLLFLAGAWGVMHAQTDPASAILHVNNVKVTVNANGALFCDLQDGAFTPTTPSLNNGIPLMRVSGLWLAGKSPTDTLVGAVQLYNEEGRKDFVPGITSSTGETLEFNKIWRVTYQDILEHQADYADNGIIDNPNSNVFSWPARGNQFFYQYNGFNLPSTTQSLADFHDENGNTFYEPFNGEYPKVSVRGCTGDNPPPNELLWFAFHDNTEHTQSSIKALNMEIQCQVFAFHCTESNALNNSIFVRYKLIYRGLEVLDPVYFGVFTDFDIGNPADDFFGTDTYRSILYGYNGDGHDEGGFGNHAPALAIDHLRGPWDSALPSYWELPLKHAMPVSITDPTDEEVFNLLSGLYPDGAPGENDGFLYTDYPDDPGGWSEVTENNTPGDRKTITSFGPFQLSPGQVNEIILGYTFYHDPSNTPIQNVKLILSEGNVIQHIFDNCFYPGSFCTIDTTFINAVHPLPTRHLKIFPNPVCQGTLLIESTSADITAAFLFDVNGKQISHKKWPAPVFKEEMDVSALPAGVYFLEVEKLGGYRRMHKIIVL